MPEDREVGYAKTLRLRIVKPVLSDADQRKQMQESLEKYKKGQQDKAIKKLGHRPTTKEERHIIQNARHVTPTKSDFFKKAKGQYGDEFIMWDELGTFLREYQKKIAESYNKSMSELYIALQKEDFNKQKEVNNCATRMSKELGSSYTAQGVASKLASNFRAKDLLIQKMSLPTIIATNTPIPIRDSEGFELITEDGDFILNIPVPKYKLNGNKLILPNKLGTTKHIFLLLATKGRKKNKTWFKDAGTDAEIKRIVTKTANGKSEHENRWLEYLHTLPDKKKENLLEIYKRKSVQTRTLAKEFNVNLDELKKNKELRDTYYKKHMELHPLENEDFEAGFLKSNAKIKQLEIVRGKRREHGGSHWFINFSVMLPPVSNTANDDIVGGIDIGCKAALVCAVNGSPRRYKVKGNEVMAHNLRIKARRRYYMSKNFLQRAGHGSKNKMKKIDALDDGSEEFKKKIIERWAMDAVRFFKREHVGLVQMENLTSMKEKSDDYFNSVLRISWPYAKMQQQIERKLHENGIEVRYVSPKHTSMTCSKCHKLNEGFNFEFRKSHGFPPFKCIDASCGFIEDADINAAWNIANPNQEGAKNE